MRLAKRSTYITFVLSIISLGGIFLFRQPNQLYDISLAIFGSAVLSFIIAILQYGTERKKSLFDFYSSASSISDSLSHIVYYHVDKHKEDIIRSIQSNFPDILVSDYEIIESDENLFKSVNSYISLSNIELDKFKNSYGSLDFLIGNIFFKRWIEKNIYSNIIETIDYINEIEGDTFIFFASSGNIVYCLEKIIELNGFIFSKESRENGNIIVYNRVHNEISENIERFRCRIFKQKFKQSTDRQIVFMEINMKVNVNI